MATKRRDTDGSGLPSKRLKEDTEIDDDETLKILQDLERLAAEVA